MAVMFKKAQNKKGLKPTGTYVKTYTSNYLDVELVKCVFTLNITPLEKIVLLCIIAQGKYHKYTYSNRLYRMAGCGESSAKKAIKSLIEAEHLIRTQQGEYIVLVKGMAKGWLNINQFNLSLAQPVKYTLKLVLLSLATFIPNNSNECYPKLETISKICGLSPKIVSKILTELNSSGLIERYKKNFKWYVISKLKEVEEEESTSGDIKKQEKSKSGAVGKPGKSTSGGVSNNTTNIITINKDKQQSSTLQVQDKSSYSMQGDKVHREPVEKTVEMQRPKDLINLWTSKVLTASCNGETVSLQMTNKMHGQIKTFFAKIFRYCGNPYRVMSFVLENWDSCCSSIEKSCGLYKTPNTPNLDFLIKHTNELYLYYNKIIKNEDVVSQIYAEQSKQPKKEKPDWEKLKAKMLEELEG